jgi:uncharacterized protein (TIGR00251 family)
MLLYIFRGACRKPPEAGTVAEDLLEITVSPKSSRSAVAVDEAGRVKVYLNSPPVDGRANEECLGLLAKGLGIAKSRLSIDRGSKGRKKLVRVDGMSGSEIIARLRGAK